jgi:hypothetical protein
MNYIAANLLFHAEETLAFWLFEHLFKKFQIRDLYIASTTNFIDFLIFFLDNLDFPGLSKHLQLIDMLIMIHLPDLYSHLVKNM